LALGDADQTVAGHNQALCGQSDIAKRYQLCEMGRRNVLASGELSATSIKEANSSRVRSFGALTLIGDDSGLSVVIASD
jgi:hypothetical protein